MKKTTLLFILFFYSLNSYSYKDNNKIYDLTDRYMNHQISKGEFKNELNIVLKNDSISSDTLNYLEAFNSRHNNELNEVLTQHKTLVNSSQINTNLEQTWLQKNKNWIIPVGLVFVLGAIHVANNYQFKIISKQF